MPTKAVTQAEMTAMLAEAAEALASVAIDKNYDNTYGFAAGVIVLPDGTQAVLTAENEVTLTDCSTVLKAGDIFAIVQDGFPMVKKAVSVKTLKNQQIVQVENVAMEEAFTDLDMQGEMEADLSQVQAVSENVKLVYIVGGTEENNWEDGVQYSSLEKLGNQEVDAVYAIQSFDIPQDVREKFNIADGVKLEVKCSISDVKTDFKAKLLQQYAHFKVSANVKFSCNLSLDIAKASGITEDLEITRIPIGLIGYIKADYELSCKGSMALVLEEKVSTGIQYQNKEFRIIKEFEKKDFTINAKASVTGGVKVSIGFDIIFLEGKIYARMGATVQVEAVTYTDGKSPKVCTQVAGYMYLEVGAEVELDLGLLELSCELSHDIYSKSNSPIRIVFHYEDGVPVYECTRDGEEAESGGSSGTGGGAGSGTGTKKHKYYTPITSKYGYSGASSGKDAEGNTYTIFDYSLEGGNATITSYNGNVSALCIPDTLDGHPVVGIDYGVFRNNTKLKIVVIPDSVTYIGDWAFENCSNLSSVTLSKNLEKIGCGAFRNCDKLTSIEIPKSLDVCDYAGYDEYEGAFNGCDGLRTVTFEKGTTQIAERLFANCPGIETIEIPETVTIIELKAFLNCANLKEVTIPNSVTTIEDYAFSKCIILEEINIPDSVTFIENSVFRDCESLHNIRIPNYITTIEWYAFYNTALKELTLPDSVTEVENYAFANCAALEKVVTSANLKTLGDAAFRNCTALSSVTLKDKLTTIGQYAFYNCDALTGITIPDSVTSLGIYCFADCEVLKDVHFGNGLTSIPSYGFNLCPALEKVVLPYRIATINQNAFSNCTRLKEISIPRATTTIGANAFSYPTKMTIYGISGSYAETYANEVGATFVSQEVPATEVKLSAETLSLNKGQNATLVLTVTPSDFTDEVSWVSADTGIATVSDAGVVTAKAVGNTTIKVYVGDLSTSCKVTVTQPVTGISLNKTSLTLEGLEQFTLVANVSPSNANNKEVAWSTADAAIATVDENGLVTAVAKGTTTITVTAKDGSGVSRNCTVTVTCDAHLCTEVAELESKHNYSNNLTEVWYYTLADAEKICVTFDERTNVEEDFDFLYLYDSTGELVGKYTGIQLAGQTITIPGDSVKIKLVTNAGGTAWGFKVTEVTEAADVILVTNIVLDKSSLDLNVSDSYTLVATITPDDATNKEVTWASTDEAVATVDSTGKVTAVSAGSAAITATAKDESGVSASCTVTVTGVNTQEQQIRAFVSRMYTVALGREAETEGLDFYTDRLIAGDSNGACLAESFLTSPEFKGKGYDDAQYVKVLYLTFFDREPAEEEVNYWVETIASGQSREFVLSGFVNSVEFDNLCISYGISRGFMKEDGKPLNPGIGRFVERFYTVVLERAGEKEGIEYWSQMIANGTCTPKDAAKSFFLSEEYINKNTSDEKYITTLYRTFMGREPEDGGVEYWQGVLNNGATREQILEGFADSAEFQGIMAGFGL